MGGFGRGGAALGQYDRSVATRTSLPGPLDSPVVVYWNLGKK